MENRDNTADLVEAEVALLRARVVELERINALHLQTEDLLRRNEETFQLFADNTSEVLYILNLETGQVEYINEAIERLTGFTVEESLTHTLDMVMPPDTYREYMPKQVERARRFLSGEPGAHVYVDELRHLRKDGSIYASEVSSRYMCNRRGQPITIGVLRDITERKQMQQALETLNRELEARVAVRTAQLESALTELKRAAKLKDEFMAAVSHELRTPLTGVLGMAEVLELQTGGPLTERQARYVQSIRQSGDRLLSMINGILRYTNLMAVSVTVRQETCRLDEICAIAVRSVHTRAEKKEQTVELSIEPAELAIVSDSDGIIQTLQQLLDNAVKFTPNGGRIGLQVRNAAGQDAVDLVVWDTGIGITDEQRATIFQPFVQGDGTLARQYGGIGLGLAYVQRMVELLAGTITLESTPGAGSRFTVTLPTTPGKLPPPT